MAENTRMKEVNANIAKLFEMMEATPARVEEENRARMETFQKALESFMIEAEENRHSRPSPPPITHGSNSSMDPNAQNHRQPFQVQNVKIDFPRFDGSNVMEWIFRAQQFFDYYDTPELDRVTIASIHMDKQVIPWFQMIQRTTPFTSWDALTRALEIEFGPSIFDCP